MKQDLKNAILLTNALIENDRIEELQGTDYTDFVERLANILSNGTPTRVSKPARRKPKPRKFSTRHRLSYAVQQAARARHLRGASNAVTREQLDEITKGVKLTLDRKIELLYGWGRITHGAPGTYLLHRLEDLVQHVSKSGARDHVEWADLVGCSRTKARELWEAFKIIT